MANPANAGYRVDELLLPAAFWFDEGDDEIPSTSLDKLIDFDIFSHNDEQPASSSARAASQLNDTEERKKVGRRRLTEEERQQKEKEKNRRAQVRYRQRQKEKKQFVAQQFEEAGAELEKAHAEHASLRRANDLLEKLLVVKDSSLAILESAKEGAYTEAQLISNMCPSSEPAAGPTASAACGSLYASVGRAGADVERKGGQSGSETSQADRVQCPDTSSKGGGMPSSSAGSEQLDEVSSAPANMPSITYHHGFEEEPLDIRQLSGTVEASLVEYVKRCTPEVFLDNWRSYARQAKDVLDEYDVTHDKVVLLRLKPLMEDRALSMTLMLQHNRQCLLQLLSCSFEEGAAQAQNQEKYDTIAKALHITPTQRKRQQATFATFKRELQRLRQERDDVVDRMSRASSMEFLPVGGLRQLTLQYMRVAEEASLLSDYPEKELFAFLELLSGCGRTFTPLQKARAASLAYPHFPDLIQLMNAFERLETT